jgi:CPA2 family monovalent cation:H+ antiporter-2
MPEASPHDYSMLRDAIVILMAAIVIVPLFQRFRLNAIVGYLVAGLVVGPYGMALVKEVEGSHRLAELGIVFMLFAIGLELSLERLRVMARYVFGLGVAQVAAAGLVLGLGAMVVFGAGWEQAAVIGGALALSSTAFVLQLLAQRGELSTHLGRVILSVLLLQDLAVVPGLAIVTALGAGSDTLAWTLTLAGLKALAALAVLLVLGRLVLRPLYRVIAGTRSPELFAAATLLVVLATAWGSAVAGLSMGLGAFLAGLMLAGTEYRHQIEADIRPVRGILLGLFFMSIGMLVDLRTVVPQLPQIAAIVVLLVLSKALILTALGLLFRLSLAVSASVGLHLAQGGEFAFVLFSLAMGTTVIPVDTGQLLLAAVAVSMAITPLLALAGRTLEAWLEQRGLGGVATLKLEAQVYSNHVVIAGFGRVGRTVAQMLDVQQIQWVAVDRDAARVSEARARNLPVFFGDAAQESITRAARVDHARAAVITLDDPKAAISVVKNLRSNLPDLPVIVRARDSADFTQLVESGASDAVEEAVESSLLLGKAVLRNLGQSDSQIELAADRVRQAVTKNSAGS